MAGHKTGCVQWPGTEVETMGCDKIWIYGDSDIVTDVDKRNNSRSPQGRMKNPKLRRSLEDDYELEESFVEEPVIVVENITDEIRNEESMSVSHPSDTEKFFFNKTSDRVNVKCVLLDKVTLFDIILICMFTQEWLLWTSQVQSIVSWLTAETDPLNLVLFHVGQPANCIRAFGPDSVEAHQALQKLDQLIALLVEKLQLKGVLDDINIVLTGVHGFVEVSADKVFNVRQFLPTHSEELLVGHSPVLNVKHTEKNDLDILFGLQKGPTEKFDIHIQSKIPESFHYKNSDRVGVITLVAKEGYAFQDVFHDFKIQDTEHQRSVGVTILKENETMK